MPLPTNTAIEYLHRRYANNQADFERIFLHCQIVLAICNQLIATNGLTVDDELVRVGALLHDIGVYILEPDEAYIRHGICGATILKKEGLPQNICRMAACHSGMGITKEDIIEQKLPLPLHDYVAETDEELLVMYADNFCSKGSSDGTKGLHYDSFDSARNEMAEFGKSKLFDAAAAKFGKPDLGAIAAELGGGDII